MAAVLEETRLTGSQQPRIEVIPEGEEHPKWPEVLALLDRLGIRLDPWQLRILWASLLVHDGQWAAFAVAVCCPRQNGKNAILEARELAGALVLGEELIIHTAHLADTSDEAFRRLEDLIDSNDWLAAQVKHVLRTNGKAAILFNNGNRIRFRTRTRGGGRGFSGSPVVFDEPMFLPEVSMSSILPVVSAQPDPQIWYTGSAVDQLEHEHGVVFSRVRDRALQGDSDRLAYFEWSLDLASPDDFTEEMAQDPECAAATNPAYSVRISPSYLEEEFDHLGLRGSAVERYGVGDWHIVDGEAPTVIPMENWEALTDTGSKIVGPVCFAFDVTPTRSWSSIAAAGRRADGLGHVEVVDRRPGTGWVVPRLAELVAAHETSGVACDERGPAASLLSQAKKAKVDVTAVSGPDHAKACGGLFDAVEQASVHHLGTAELTAALKGAATRPLGDAWAWSRKSSAVDISPLVASTLALWAVVSGAAKYAPAGSWVPL